MHRYEIIILWSNEDEAFIADIPVLRGCKAHGNSQREALGIAQEAIELRLEPARVFGDPIPETNDQRLINACFRIRQRENRLGLEWPVNFRLLPRSNE